MADKKSRVDQVVGSVQSKADNLVPQYRGEKEQTLYGTGIEANDDTDIDDDEFEELYKRNPIAFRAIQKFSKDPVQSGFKLVDEADTEEKTEFEKQVEEVKDKVDFDKHLIKTLKYGFLYGSADMAYGLVHNAGSDNAKSGEPVDESTVQGVKFVNVVKEPFVEEYELNRDPMDENFGELEAIEVNIDTEDTDGDQVTLSGDKTDTRKIHRDRFQHFKAFEVDEHPQGFGLLHPAYNTLKTFENVLFGAGQSFFYAGTGFPHFEVEGMDDEEFEDFKQELGSNILEQPYFASEKGAIDVNFKGNEGAVLDPTNYFEPMWDILGSSFGGSKQILFGREAGEIKGSEINKEEYYGDIESMQTEKITPFVRKFFDRMIEYGVISEPQGDGYEVVWNDLYSKSDEVKSEIANNKSKAFSRYKKAGLSNGEAAELAGIDPEQIEDLEAVGTVEGNPEDPGGRDPEDEQEENAEDSAKNDADDSEDGDDKVKMDIEQHQLRYDAIENVLAGFDKDEVGFEEDSYFQLGEDESRTDYELTKPTHWSKDLYSIYMDMREDLLDMHHEFVEDVVEIVDKSTLGEDRVTEDSKRLVKAQFQNSLEQRIEEFEDEAEDRTRVGMKSAFLVGAKDGAGDLDLTPDEIFNKHRQQVVERLADTHMTPAYSNTTDEVSEKINEAVEDYFNTKDQGIQDLKRNIRGIAGGDTSLDYRYERIARTETARLRNTGYVTEAARNGHRTFDWTGPIDQRKCTQCLEIIDGNPYTQEELAVVTNGLVPHPNCRDTAVVAETDLLSDMTYERVSSMLDSRGKTA